MKGKGVGKRPEAVTDERFAAVHRDPRFSRFPRKQAGVTIDERFKGVLDDPDFQVTSTLNKHGKKVKKHTSNDDMRRFYHLQEPEKGAEAAGAMANEKKQPKQPKVAAPPPELVSASDDDDDAPAEVAIKKTAQAATPRLAQSAAAPLTAPSPAPSKTRFDSDSDKVDAAGSDDEDSDENAAAAPVRDGSDAAASDEEADLRAQRMRGIGAAEESSSEEEGSGDEGGDLELAIGEDQPVELDPAEWGIGAAAGNPDVDATLLELSEATARLAVVDLEWRRMRAVDILAVLQSFLPKGGAVRRVTVYVSDYGRAAMERERVDGPQGLRSEAAAEADSDAEVEVSDAVAQERVRMYERSKLRWHFAIAEFNTPRAAAAVYAECDGIEFEESSTRFDLRFVPDSEDFSKREVRDSASDVPSSYEAPMFKSKALQHTKPTLTWDEDDDSRKKALQRTLGADEIKEDDFRAYLASESEEEEGEDARDADAIRKRYAALVGGDKVERVGRRNDNGVKPWLTDEDGAAPAKQEMEVTFASGLEGLGKRILDKRATFKARAGQTLFEQYLQRKKDKKAAQRAVGRVNVDSESDEDGGASSSDGGAGVVAGDSFFDDEGDAAEGGKAEAGFNDDFFNDVKFDEGAQSDEEAPTDARGRKKLAKIQPGKAPKTADERRRAAQEQAELELLILDDAQLAAAKDGVAAAALAAPSGAEDAKRRLSRKQLMAAKKEERKRTKERRGSDDDEDFDADIEDPRFKALLENPEFAIDSSNPQFSRIRNPKRLITEISHRRKRLRTSSEAAVDVNAGAANCKGKAELAALVGNLKRKGSNQKSWG